MSKKKKEIVVKGPIFTRIRYKCPETLFMEERINFFRTCGTICKYLAWPIMVSSIFLFLFASYHILNLIQFSFPKPLFITVSVSIGVMNILSGLLLLAKE